MEFGFDSFGTTWSRIDQAQIQVFPAFRHNKWVAQLNERDVQFFGHVLFCFLDSHASGHLHARHQISGGAHPAHARRNSVSRGHAENISHAHLQSVQAGYFNHSL